MPPVGFEPTISAGERPQTYDLDRAATGTGANQHCTELKQTHMFISVFNQLDAQNLFHNNLYFMPLRVSSTFAHHQEVKIELYSLWYHHTYRWPSRAR